MTESCSKNPIEFPIYLGTPEQLGKYLSSLDYEKLNIALDLLADDLVTKADMEDKQGIRDKAKGLERAATQIYDAIESLEGVCKIDSEEKQE